jgi:malate dehydrogenase (oxaloacetate-decarboxylating)
LGVRARRTSTSLFGQGLGVVASGARRVTDAMILAAARTLGETSPALTDPSAALLPALPHLRKVAAHMATGVGLEAQRDSVAPKTSEAELHRRAAAAQWGPAYPSVGRRADAPKVDSPAHVV